MAEPKRVLITGATTGIGKEAAFQLARRGYEVILHGRNAEKAASVKADIQARHPNAKLDILIADLESKADTIKLVDTFYQRYDALDVLINNAGGVMNKVRQETVDGWERTIALNVLAPFMCSALLLPALQRGTDAKIINTSSMAHIMGKPSFDDLMYETKFNTHRAYGDAKLYVILLGIEFARRQQLIDENNPIGMYAFHPGVIASDFAKNSTSLYHHFFRLFRPFLSSVERGADTMVYLATQNNDALQNGGYYVRRKARNARLPTKTLDAAAQLWERCESLTGIRFGVESR
ncbi:short-chain dehydrogenase [Parapedobacter pyrenivorans]|uniref:Short-chain dehydrogenase n=1 Tax=Parapedobacter pyrenivorans TaxID=1305674 RepID=A0A917HZZ9_9SPHI|nr:SDR family NAD(P)-dependent oxidoreductase [Parapedobacter pyrenivorans]GGH00506.1 short-chain dehydrogenase [Parapedobacter pyrenivorans]